MKRNTLSKKKVRNSSQYKRVSSSEFRTNSLRRPRKMKFSKRPCYGRSCRKGMLMSFVTQQQMAEQIPSIDI